MTIADLFFLASMLGVVSVMILIVVSLARGRWAAAKRLCFALATFLLAYAAALVVLALALPRRVYAEGQRRCFDDWCVTAIETSVDKSPAPGCRPDASTRVWITTIEVASEARRVRQRAPDARAELEDGQGRRYSPCAAPSAHNLSDSLEPGESFPVVLPFRLPREAEPVGTLIHHGDFPGVVIIGADQSFLHTPALQRLAVKR